MPKDCFIAIKIPIATSTLLFSVYDKSLTRKAEQWCQHRQQRQHQAKELSYIILKSFLKKLA